MAYTNGAATRPTSVDSVYSIAYKIARTIIENAKIKGHYQDFEKDELEFGGILEDLAVSLRSSTTYNPNAAAGSVTFSYDNVIKRYFGDWSEKRFDTIINRHMAKLGMNNPADFDKLVANMVDNLTQSETAEANDLYKNFFQYVATTATAVNDRLITVYGNNTAKGGHVTTAAGLVNTSSYLPSGSCYEVLSKPTIDDVLTEVRNVCKDMEYKNTTYQGVNTFPCEVSIEDLRIVVPFKWLNKVNVEKLAEVFNLDKASMLAKIVETDGCEFTYTDATATTGQFSSAHGYTIIICDKDAIGRTVRDKTLEQFYDRDKVAHGYTLVEGEMLYYNPLKKAYAIVFTDDETVA